jgi:preprotein translocase subunit YajC
MGFVVLLILFGGMWMLLIRPQQQRLRAQRQLVASLDVGDEVVTAGGVVARIVRLDDQEADLEIAPGVVVTFLRAAISRRLEPGERGERAETGFGGAGVDGGGTSSTGASIEDTASAADGDPGAGPTAPSATTPTSGPTMPSATTPTGGPSATAAPAGSTSSTPTGAPTPAGAAGNDTDEGAGA